jgi:hypothetical protein
VERYVNLYSSIGDLEQRITVDADMVATEERKINQRKKAVAAQEAEDRKHKNKEVKKEDKEDKAKTPK